LAKEKRPVLLFECTDKNLLIFSSRLAPLRLAYYWGSHSKSNTSLKGLALFLDV